MVPALSDVAHYGMLVQSILCVQDIKYEMFKAETNDKERDGLRWFGEEKMCKNGDIKGKNHRIIECCIVRDLKDQLIATPHHRKGHLALNQVAQRPNHPSLEHFYGWGIHSFSGHSIPVPLNKEFIPYI